MHIYFILIWKVEFGIYSLNFEIYNKSLWILEKVHLFNICI